MNLEDVTRSAAIEASQSHWGGCASSQLDHSTQFPSRQAALAANRIMSLNIVENATKIPLAAGGEEDKRTDSKGMPREGAMV